MVCVWGRRDVEGVLGEYDGGAAGGADPCTTGAVLTGSSSIGSRRPLVRRRPCVGRWQWGGPHASHCWLDGSDVPRVVGGPPRGRVLPPSEIPLIAAQQCTKTEQRVQPCPRIV